MRISIFTRITDLIILAAILTLSYLNVFFSFLNKIFELFKDVAGDAQPGVASVDLGIGVSIAIGGVSLHI